MSNYTDKMVEILVGEGSWTYDDCASFARDHGLSTRSVISKVKSLGLSYVPKTVAPANPKAARPLKAEIVAKIAKAINVHVETVEGLSKADSKSLQALLIALQS